MIKQEKVYPAWVVMGVSGCGKSFIGSMKAERTAGACFLEGDTLHPAANIRKMESGIPLEDADRWGWLDTLGKEIARRRSSGCCIASCSSLKKSYRDRLRALVPGLQFLYLKGEQELIRKRMEQREHFMPPSLLDSQFATLEEPGPDEKGVFICSIEESPEEILKAWPLDSRLLD